MDFVRCTRCAKQVPPDSRFCRRCGCAVAERRVAPRAVAAKSRTSQSTAKGAIVFGFFGFIFLMGLIGWFAASARPEPRIEYIPFQSGGGGGYNVNVHSSGVFGAQNNVVMRPETTSPFPVGYDSNGRWIGIDTPDRTSVRPLTIPQPVTPSVPRPYTPRTYAPGPANSGNGSPNSR